MGILLSQQMSDTIKHIIDDIFFFQENSALVHMQCACNTVQLLWLSRLPFSFKNHAHNSLTCTH